MGVWGRGGGGGATSKPLCQCSCHKKASCLMVFVETCGFKLQHKYVWTFSYTAL